MTNAVLSIEDQRTDRAPTHCVTSGQHTVGAVRVWAIESNLVNWIVGLAGIVGVAAACLAGRKVMRITLPVEKRRWKIWQRRATLAALMLSFGAGVVVAGAIRADPALIVVGGLIAALSVAIRARAFWNFWVSAQLRPEQGDILIRRAHARFSDDARKLYTARLNRH